MEDHDEYLIIPAHSELKTALEAWRRHNALILASSRSRGMSAASLGNLMADAISAADLPDRCVTHGLRKASARRLAEAGCSAKEIMSITGHKTLEEVERYIRQADQGRFVKSAIARLEEQWGNQ